MARKANGKRSVSRDGSVRVHGKASNGEGSVYLDADGSWRATYVAPGSARPKRVRGKTREEAIARRAVKLEELSQIQSSTFHRDAGHLDHGYAMTIHKAQGLAADEALVLATDDLYQEGGYTALSRARLETRVFLAADDFDDDPNIDLSHAGRDRGARVPESDLARSLNLSRGDELAIDR
jgi:hypothetical protein